MRTEEEIRKAIIIHEEALKQPEKCDAKVRRAYVMAFKWVLNEEE